MVGSGTWCADCSAEAFTSRLGGRLARVSTPCLCTDSARLEGGTNARRDTLRSLLGLLDDLTPASQGDPLEPSAYVLWLSMPTDEEADLEAEGVDLAGFVETENGGLCGMVPASNPIGAAIIAAPNIFARVQFGDEVRSAHARPAYPHEHTCADIDT